jgi:hypothetical protein
LCTADKRAGGVLNASILFGARLRAHPVNEQAKYPKATEGPALRSDFGFVILDLREH